MRGSFWTKHDAISSMSGMAAVVLQKAALGCSKRSSWSQVANIAQHTALFGCGHDTVSSTAVAAIAATDIVGTLGRDAALEHGSRRLLTCIISRRQQQQQQQQTVNACKQVGFRAASKVAQSPCSVVSTWGFFVESPNARPINYIFCMPWNALDICKCTIHHTGHRTLYGTHNIDIPCLLEHPPSSKRRSWD